ncbi:MAG: alpha/beta fold hydrolase [Bacillota bacterium]|nr:alpha/beta fold hydrolase [Bacillota bacterium]MDP4169990.1 alpha/beta fold hydrolase [Bacillota bacterium]
MEKHYSIIDGADSFFFKGNEIGILICHGFNGTPQSVRYVGERFASEGFTVFAPRLEGHGTHYHELEACHFNDWINNIYQAYSFLKKSCREVFVIGQSMGGALALNLASLSVPLSGIITINAALSVPSYQSYLTEQTIRFIPEDRPDIKAENVYEIVYNSVPVAAIKNLLHLLVRTERILSRVSCPALIIKSKEDHVVPPENSDDIYSNISSQLKKSIILENSYHVATMDHDKQKIVDETLIFIKTVSPTVSKSANIL